MRPVCLPESNLMMFLMLFWRNSYKEMGIKMKYSQDKIQKSYFDEYFNDSCSIKGRTRCFNFQSKKNYSTTNIALTRDTLKNV